MTLSVGRFSAGLYCIIFVLLATQATGDNSTCGALITYNQFSSLLESAPTCFRTGCGGNLTSMSSACNSNAPCYPVWKILNEEYQQDWCSNCTGDVACRISGWPILNATAACNISPNTWLFGNGGCCINGSEPSALSSWIETTCNDTWRTQFEPYNGMAQQDWEQYELPWNWTVQSNIVPQPTCAAKPLYLGLFAIENTVFVIFVVIYGAITLWIIRGKEIRNPFVLFILKVLTPLRLLKKGIGAFFTFICCLGKTDNGTGSVVSTIIMAVVFAGIQLSFNFATAYIIKYTPGYEDIPAPLLALLFCCRPRLGWLACALSRTPDRWLRQYFHLTPPDSLVRGQIAVARVAVSSAMSEVIMQLLGSYFLGKTAHIGAVRGFYLNGHLLPYFRGAQARLMYVGAMFWLVAGFGVVIVWIMVVFLHAKILHFYTTTKSWLKNLAATTIPEKVQPRRMHSWRKSEQPPRRRRSRIRSTDELNSRYDEGHYMRGGAGTPGTYGSDQLAPGFQNIRRDGGTFSSQNGASTPSAFDSLPMRPQDFPQAASSSQGGRPRTHRNGYTAVETTNPEMFQAGSGDFPPLLGVEYEENFRARTPTTTAYTRDDPGYIQRANFSSNAYPDVGYHGVENRDRENEGQREKSPPYDPETHIPSNFKEWQPYILALGIFLGFISYIAQWLFWAGFVNAAGERFCPPRLGFVGTLWSIAAILGLGSSFGLQ